MSERDEQPDEPRQHSRYITAEQNRDAIREDREAEQHYRAMRAAIDAAEADIDEALEPKP